MLRQILALMLVPVLLANQAAMCCAHSHQGGESDGHSARTHIHFAGEAHGSNSGSHHHGDHDHSGNHDHSDEPVDGSESIFSTNLPSEHDSDALYFGVNGDFQISPNRITVDKPALAILVVDSIILRIAKSERQTQVTRAGPFSRYHCAIYLQTSRLLI